jgi:glycosyltransferase involved in cell wall biosynthesis
LAAGSFDVFHPTYYDPYFLEYLGDKPFVLTIHDMIHEKFPELFDLGDATAAKKKRLAEKAAGIIAVSENTKRDIVELYGMDPGRVSVVYHGSQLARGGKVGAGLPERYILFTGTRASYKNFYFFVASIARVLLEEPDLYLVCSGSSFSANELEFFAHLGIGERVIRRAVAEGELYAYYAGALFFAFPSYYEGFGIPILEAFEAGCPALLAKASCFPEIAGDAALYFDPKDSGALADGARELIRSQALRAELSRKGRERFGQFSWDETYRKTAECYHRALGR